MVQPLFPGPQSLPSKTRGVSDSGGVDRIGAVAISYCIITGEGIRGKQGRVGGEGVEQYPPGVYHCVYASWCVCFR